MNNELDFETWLEHGIEKGWVSSPYCATHDGGLEYMNDEELQQWEEGGDPCQVVLRIIE